MLERALWELKNEKNKNHVRWLLVVVVGAYLSYLLWSGQARQIGPAHLFTWNYIIALTICGLLFASATAIYLGRASEKGAWPGFKYLSMLFDLVLITLILLPTGGNASMLFILYFVVVVSNALRYGMRSALVGVFAFNILYVGLLLYQFFPGDDIPGFAREVLKVAGVWLVGIYTGYLARRFENLQGEVEKYKKLVARLTDREDKNSEGIL